MQAQPQTQPTIEIRSSNRRRKSGVAYWENGRIVVVVPGRMSRSASETFAKQLAEGLLSRSATRHASDGALAARAAELGDRYFDGVRPASIRWSTRQLKRWGSCSLHSREIRIAARLQTVPEWVLDAVIVHELAHLIEANHTARFYSLTARYERHDEAHVYLDGFGHGLTSAGYPVSTEEAADVPGTAAPGPGRGVDPASEPAEHPNGEIAACAWHRVAGRPAR